MQLTRLKIATLGTPMSFPVWWIPTRQPVGKYADPGTQPGQCLSPASSMQLTRLKIATLGTPDVLPVSRTGIVARQPARPAVERTVFKARSHDGKVAQVVFTTRGQSRSHFQTGNLVGSCLTSKCYYNQ